MSELEEMIVGLVGREGPLTGLEIKKAIDVDSLPLWKVCKTSRSLQVRAVGRRYLRLDRHVEGFARLSPSILREFFTYSVVGLASDPDALDSSCREAAARIGEISSRKLELARRMVSHIMTELGEGGQEDDRFSFIVAGDIVYGMAHEVPRPERSMGRLVRGSDIDLVVAARDDVPDSFIERLDGIIYRKKYRMLIDPDVNEEVDYKIKKLALIREQTAFDSFPRMVAMKILQEGVLIHGSRELFGEIKGMIEEKGLLARLSELEGLAETFRRKAEESILYEGLNKEAVERMHLFYSAEEFEEFE